MRPQFIRRATARRGRPGRALVRCRRLLRKRSPTASSVPALTPITRHRHRHVPHAPERAAAPSERLVGQDVAFVGTTSPAVGRRPIAVQAAPGARWVSSAQHDDRPPRLLPRALLAAAPRPRSPCACRPRGVSPRHTRSSAASRRSTARSSPRGTARAGVTACGGARRHHAGRRQPDAALRHDGDAALRRAQRARAGDRPRTVRPRARIRPHLRDEARARRRRRLADLGERVTSTRAARRRGPPLQRQRQLDGRVLRRRAGLVLERRDPHAEQAHRRAAGRRRAAARAPRRRSSRRSR